MEKKFINPAELPNWERSFSQVVAIHSGTVKTIYLSGQVAVDQEHKIIGQGDLKVQAQYAFCNLRKALAAAGASAADVVKMTIYVVNYKPADATVIGEVVKQVFGDRNLPASTWLGVRNLALEGLLIEVEAVAAVES